MDIQSIELLFIRAANAARPGVDRFGITPHRPSIAVSARGLQE
jgi:hypothetical protein